MRDGKLQMDATDRTERFIMPPKDVSVEFFIAERCDIDTNDND
jgi:hypothetical protein